METDHKDIDIVIIDGIYLLLFKISFASISFETVSYTLEIVVEKNVRARALGSTVFWT